MITRSRSGHHRVIIRFASGFHRVLFEWSLKAIALTGSEARSDELAGSSLDPVTIRRRAPFRRDRVSFRRGGTAGGSKTTVQIGSGEIWEFGSKLLPLVTPSPTVSGSREYPLFPTAVIHPCLRPGLKAVVQLWAFQPSPLPPDQQQANPPCIKLTAQLENGS
jgi:hypothetical protein